MSWEPLVAAYSTRTHRPVAWSGAIPERFRSRGDRVQAKRSRKRVFQQPPHRGGVVEYAAVHGLVFCRGKTRDTKAVNTRLVDL